VSRFYGDLGFLFGLKKICPASFRETCQWLKFPLNGLGPKLLEYKGNWIKGVNRMPRNRFARVMKHTSPNGKRNYGRPLKRLLDM
jgi:hypothetical protein